MDPFVVLFSIFGPFLVWPIEFLLPYPFIVEELFKTVVVWFGPKNIKPYYFAGFFFALTETVFYISNVNTSGTLLLMLVRFLSTGILHSVTFLIIYLSGRSQKKYLLAGFILSTLIHYLYNLYIPMY